MYSTCALVVLRFCSRSKMKSRLWQEILLKSTITNGQPEMLG